MSLVGLRNSIWGWEDCRINMEVWEKACGNVEKFFVIVRVVNLEDWRKGLFLRVGSLGSC